MSASCTTPSTHSSVSTILMMLSLRSPKLASGACLCELAASSFDSIPMLSCKSCSCLLCWSLMVSWRNRMRNLASIVCNPCFIQLVLFVFCFLFLSFPHFLNLSVGPEKFATFAEKRLKVIALQNIPSTTACEGMVSRIVNSRSQRIVSNEHEMGSSEGECGGGRVLWFQALR